ncbi:hypothetical protein ACSQ67_023667 [Phaseolus vulgaris]
MVACTNKQPRRHTTTHQRATTLPMARSCVEREKWLPGFKNWLPIHSMNMCHKPKPTPTHDPTMDPQTTINAHNNGSTIHQRSISACVYLNVEGHTTTNVCSYLRLEFLPFSLPPQCRRRQYQCLLFDWMTPSTVSSLTSTDVPFFHHRRLCPSLDFAPNSFAFTTKKNSEITILPSHKLTLTSIFTKNRRCLVQYNVFCIFVYVSKVKSVTQPSIPKCTFTLHHAQTPFSSNDFSQLPLYHKPLLRFIDVARGQKLHIWRGKSTESSFPSLFLPSAPPALTRCKQSGNVITTWRAHDGYVTKMYSHKNLNGSGKLSSSFPEGYILKLISTTLQEFAIVARYFQRSCHSDGKSSFSIWGHDVISISWSRIGLLSLSKSANETISFSFKDPQHDRQS